MKIAVTGASGFIGQYVLRELVKASVEVIAITRDAAKLNEFADEVTVVEMDISDHPVAVFDILGSPDVLIHLAWGGLPNYRLLTHFETELPNQYEFLKSMINAGLPSLLVAGTCYEYGMKPGCLDEALIPNPKTPYGYAKDALRRQLEFLKDSSPFNLTWARLFYMYGEGQSAQSLYPSLKDAVLTGKQFFNMSGGEQKRDYLSVKVVANRMIGLSQTGKDNGIVNICSGEPILIKTLVSDWIRENNWDIKLNLGYYPYSGYEAMGFWGDATRQNLLLRQSEIS